MDPVSALVLAAGHSKRIASVANGQPKPLLMVEGVPIIGRNLRWLGASGVPDVWVNLHHRGEAIRAALGDGSAWGVRIRYSEEPVILGTAGAARKLLSELSDPYVVVYGDNLVRFDLSQLLGVHRSTRADVTVALFDASVPNTGIAGGRVVLDGTGRVTAFVEGDASAPAPYVNAGVYAVRREVLADRDADQFLDWGRDIFPSLLAKGAPVHGFPISGYCLGLDTPEAYDRGLALIASGQVTLA